MLVANIQTNILLYKVMIMARDRGFSIEDVKKAATELLAEGKNINGTSLRKKIGTGRPSALIAAYSELLDKGAISIPAQIDKAEPIKRRELPQDVNDQLSSLLEQASEMVHQINDYANHLAELRLNNAVLEATEAAANATLKVEESLAQQADAFEANEDLKDEIESLKGRLQSANDEISQLKIDKVELSSKLAASMSKVKDRDAAIAEQTKTLKKHKVALETAEKGRVKAEGQVTLLETRVTQLESDLSEFNKTTGMLEQAQTQIESMSTEIATLTGRVQDANDAKTKALNNQASLESTISGLNKELETVRGDLSSSQTYVGQLQAQVETIPELIDARDNISSAMNKLQLDLNSSTSKVELLELQNNQYSIDNTELVRQLALIENKSKKESSDD